MYYKQSSVRVIKQKHKTTKKHKTNLEVELCGTETKADTAENARPIKRGLKRTLRISNGCVKNAECYAMLANLEADGSCCRDPGPAGGALAL